MSGRGKYGRCTTDNVERPRGHGVRKFLGLGAALFAVLVVGGIAVRTWLRAAPGAVGITETVDRYRQQSSSGPSQAGRRMPEPGAYVYDTSGTESVDALGGDAHQYPNTTAMTVVAEGCGYRITWAPLEGRLDDSLVCPRDGGLEVRASTTLHEFFRRSDQEDFTCDPGAWWLPPPGTKAWTATCRTADRVSTRSGRVVGVESIQVGTQQRPAIHVHYDDVLSAGSSGTTTSDLWLDQDSGLVLKQHSEAETRNETVIGVVVFRERIDLVLRSLEPQR